MRSTSRIIATVLLCCGLGITQTTTPPPGSSTGQAIGNGVKSFVDTVFPGGSALLTLVQGWLTKKLSPQQAQQVQQAADQQKKQAIDPKVKAALTDIQTAANTMKLTSVVLYRTNLASNRIAAMLAIIDQSNPGSPLPMATLQDRWNDAKAALSSLKTDKTLADARAAITDISVVNSMQGLDDALGGAIVSVDGNLKPDGDRSILRQRLQQIFDAATGFSNLGVVLLGSTGTEITTTISNITVAGGGSDLDEVTSQSLAKAQAAVPKPAH